MKGIVKWCTAVGGFLVIAGFVATAVGLRGNLRGERGSGNASSTGETISVKLDIAPKDYAKDVEISIGAADLTLQAGDSYQIDMGSAVADYCKYSLENGVLRLWDTRKNGRQLRGRSQWANNEIVLTLPIPEGGLDSVDFDLGAGNGKISGLTVDTCSVDAGAGEYTLSGITARKLEISGGAGKLTADRLTVTEKCTLEAGVGKYDIAGNLTGDIRIEGGVGDIALRLDSPFEKNHLSISSGIGATYINGRKLHFLDGDYEDNKDAPNDVNISCGVGKITVDFNGSTK